MLARFWTHMEDIFFSKHPKYIDRKNNNQNNKHNTQYNGHGHSSVSLFHSWKGRKRPLLQGIFGLDIE